MIDLAGTDPVLARRLAAYGDLRLSPSLAATTRMRARVLAVAHRQADLSRSDAGLTLLTAGTSALDGVAAPGTRRRRTVPYRRLASALAAATLGVAMVAGASLAAEPAGPLYGARLWVEEITLPIDPGERAVAEGRRLQARLAEAATASVAGDPTRVAAALAAYESILAEASAATLASGDPIAAAALEAAVARNIVVLEGLATTLPDRASQAVTDAVERAIEHSGSAMDAIDDEAGQPGSGGNGGSGGTGGQPDPTDEPTKEPKPTKEPTPTPDPTPTPRPTPEPPDRPDPTPRQTPPGPPEPPGPPDTQGSQGSQGSSD